MCLLCNTYLGTLSNEVTISVTVQVCHKPFISLMMKILGGCIAFIQQYLQYSGIQYSMYCSTPHVFTGCERQFAWDHSDGTAHHAVWAGTTQYAADQIIFYTVITNWFVQYKYILWLRLEGLFRVKINIHLCLRRSISPAKANDVGKFDRTCVRISTLTHVACLHREFYWSSKFFKR